jgi:hypothetical protein
LSKNIIPVFTKSEVYTIGVNVAANSENIAMCLEDMVLDCQRVGSHWYAGTEKE